jgi:Amt family ammonium transporter
LVVFDIVDDDDDCGCLFNSIGAPGIVGTILLSFLGVRSGVKGIFFGGSWSFLGYQLLGALVGVVWSAFWTALLMLLIKYEISRSIELKSRYTVGGNVSVEVEEIGLDLAQLGEQAYDDQLPEFLDISRMDSLIS